MKFIKFLRSRNASIVTAAAAFVAVMLISLIYISAVSAFYPANSNKNPDNTDKNSLTAAVTLSEYTAKKADCVRTSQKSFDSFIIGSFSASAYDTLLLSEYLGGQWYNMCTDSNDPDEILNTFEYLAYQTGVKKLFLAISPYDMCTDMLESAYTVPNYTTGSVYRGYDDTNRISGETEYKTLHSYAFKETVKKDETDIEKLVNTVERIQKTCEEKEIELFIVLSPCYVDKDTAINAEKLDALKSSLEEVCSFWDFSYGKINSDSRFFYNRYEFRTALGNMVLAKIFSDKNVYVPENFGRFAELSENSPKQEQELKSYEKENSDLSSYSVEVPILLYHHIVEGDNAEYSDSIISAGLFEKHLAALKEAGYQTVSLKQLEDYVYKGAELPDNPICITFDDGYYSNYEYAFPLLEKYDMKAAVFVIGWAVGKDTYKDTGKPMYPHFDYDEALEMVSSGLVEIQSHTHDMHSNEFLEEGNNVRVGLLPMENESVSEYTQALKDDLDTFAENFTNNFGQEVRCLSYPHGKFTPLTEKIVADSGIKMTMSTVYTGKNILVKGLGQSLRALCRFTVSGNTEPDALIRMIENVYK